MKKPTLRIALNSNTRDRRPDIQLFRNAERTANTSFRDRHPDIPPLALDPRRRTTQPPAAKAAPAKPLTDHSRRTNIRGRRPGLKANRLL